VSVGCGARCGAVRCGAGMENAEGPEPSPCRPRLTEREIGAILALSNEGLSSRAIGKRLKRSNSSVARCIYRSKVATAGKRQGRPHVLTEDQLSKLKVQVQQFPTASARELANKAGLEHVCVRTVQRALITNAFVVREPAKTPAPRRVASRRYVQPCLEKSSCV